MPVLHSPAKVNTAAGSRRRSGRPPAADAGSGDRPARPRRVLCRRLPPGRNGDAWLFAAESPNNCREFAMKKAIEALRNLIR